MKHLFIIACSVSLLTTDAFHIHNNVNQASYPPSMRTQQLPLRSTATEYSSTEDQSASRLRSLKFIQLTSKTEPALLADYLMEVGASSVSITDHDAGDPDHEMPIFAEPDNANDDIFAAVVCGDAAVGKNIWMRCDVNAHFGDSFNILGIVDQVRATFDLGTTPRFEVDNVPDLDWVKEVQSSWKPVVIGGFVLRFPWHTEDDVKESLINIDVDDDIDNYTELLLEGGIAFGTGEHPTTQLCLEFITELLKEDYDGIDLFLDYGAGSGVLGMAACKLKPQLEAVGVEIDADAIRIADANAVENGVNMKSYLPRHFGDDNESASLIMKAMQRSSSDVLPEEMDGPCFDACAANILAGPLISLSGTIASMLKPGAQLGLSGILEWQGEDVVSAYSEHFDDVKVEKERGGWVLVTGSRK